MNQQARPDNPLHAKDIEHFLKFGYVKLENCFDVSPGSLASRWRTRTWLRCGYDPADPRTWAEEKIHFNRVNNVDLTTFAPGVAAAINQLLGGHAIANDPLCWGDGLIVNYRLGAEAPWIPPGPDAHDWHKDGDFFLHFLDSPEQALLTVVLWDDVVERGGPTYIAADSIAHVARFLAAHPGGVCPAEGDPERDGLPSDIARYDFPSIIRECRDFRQVTGRAGDVYLMHPFMLHTASQNVLKQPRFVSNPAVSLRDPMNFHRPDGAYSPVEQAVLHALGVAYLDFTPAAPRRRIEGGTERIRKATELERLATARADAKATP